MSAQSRKDRSEALLQSVGIPVNTHLPVIDEEDAKPRTKEVVALRALALLVVAIKGEGVEDAVVEKKNNRDRPQLKNNRGQTPIG